MVTLLVAYAGLTASGFLGKFLCKPVAVVGCRENQVWLASWFSNMVGHSHLCLPVMLPIGLGEPTARAVGMGWEVLEAAPTLFSPPPAYNAADTVNGLLRVSLKESVCKGIQASLPCPGIAF